MTSIIPTLYSVGRWEEVVAVVVERSRDCRSQRRGRGDGEFGCLEALPPDLSWRSDPRRDLRPLDNARRCTPLARAILATLAVTYRHTYGDFWHGSKGMNHRPLTPFSTAYAPGHQSRRSFHRGLMYGMVHSVQFDSPL
jgi:hypothetical protein